MKTLHLTVDGVGKDFNRKVLFEGISFSASAGSSIAIVGKNGSGKSTLVKILCGVLAPTKGTVTLSIDGNKFRPTESYPYIGLVSPYLNMYDEFTGFENLLFFSKIRQLENTSTERALNLLRQFSLFDHRNKEVRNYSSGMKQRLKYCAALLHNPLLLILDEPSSNLDEEGIVVVRKVMADQRDRGILLFATNDHDDLQFSESRVNVEKLELPK